MGALKKALSGYNPTGAFSFEIRKRNPDTGEVGIKPIFESYFLLAPEEYTMNEGYKLKVTKTLGGAWVDDFGNDVKKIILSGSLYSFFFGSPRTQLDQFIDLSALDFIKGNYAINEFFKLRYIVSRFRDKNRKNVLDKEASKLLKNYPDLSDFIVSINENVNYLGKNPYDDMVFIYHDYDDNNHYEIVFNDFQVRRSKDDPFTAFYKIEMTALKEFSSNPKFANKFLRGGLKETLQSFLSDISSTLESIAETLADMEGVRTDLVSTKETLENAISSTIDKIEAVFDGESSNWQELKSNSNENLEWISVQKVSIQSSTTGVTPDDFDDELANLFDDDLEFFNEIEKSENIYTQLAGIGLYAINAEESKIFTNDEAIIETTDFDSEISTDEDPTDNSLEQRNSLYYTIADGDTLFKISDKFFQTFDYALVIGEINGISNSAFFDNALTGITIRIPNITSSTNSGGTNNLTYYNIAGDEPPSVLSDKILGGDSELNSDRDFVTTTNGDIGVIIGEDCYRENILDRLSSPNGIIAELDPSFGIPSSIGDVPEELFQNKAEQIVAEQLYSDPRTESMTFTDDDIQLKGDTATIPIETKTVSGVKLSLQADYVYN